MNTYLLEWNPDDYPWDKVEAELEAARQSGSTAISWDVGGNRDPRPGDRAFLMRVKSNQGIIGAGRITSLPDDGPHWRQDKAAQGKTYTFVMVEFDQLFVQPLITLEELNRPPFTGHWWTPHRSGRPIPEPFATALENRWLEVAGAALALYPDEVDPGAVYREGAVVRVSVDARERNPAARRACIEHHGTNCCICGFNFGRVYGPEVDGLIHVHHLRPLSEVATEYTVDPVADLRPVCPNCHAVLHSRPLAYSIEEVQRFLERGSSG